MVVDIVKEKNSTYREHYDSHVSVQLLKEWRVNEDNDFIVGIVSTDFTEAFLCISGAYSGPCQTSNMEFFCENSLWLSGVNQFCKTFHVRCLPGFWICLFTPHSL